MKYGYEGNKSGYDHIIAIGDVHGSYGKLVEVLQQIPTNSHVIFVGDLIHKGKESKKVVDLVRKFCSNYAASCILGNHEAIAGKKEEFAGGEVGLTEDDFEWLRSRPLFLRMQYFDEDFLFVHAGMDRGSAASTLRKLIEDGKLPRKGFWGEEMVNRAVGSLSRRLKDKIGKVKYIRYLNPKGQFLPLGTEDETSTWWAEGYNGEFGQIFYGHNPFPEVKIDMHAVGIDTGAYTDEGRLTAIDVVTGRKG